MNKQHKQESEEYMSDFLAEAIQKGRYDLARKSLEEVKETFSNYDMWDNVLKCGDIFREEFPGLTRVKITIERKVSPSYKGMFKGWKK